MLKNIRVVERSLKNSQIKDGQEAASISLSEKSMQLVSLKENWAVVDQSPLERQNARKLSQGFIDRSINQWRRRLERVVQQNGGHIEHLFV